MIRPLIVLAMVAVLAAGTDRAAASSHCKEVSPVVGHQRCGSFGRWSHRWWEGLYVYEAALVVDHVALPAFDDTGRVYNLAGSATYHAQLAPGARRTLWATGPRIHLGYRGPHYTLGTDMIAAFGLGPPTLDTQVDGQPLAHAASAQVFDVAGVAGAHTRITSRLDVGGELALGVRYLDLFSALPGGYTACANGATGKTCGFHVEASWPLVELRVRADAWLRPHTTIGVAFGVDLSGRGESMVATVAYHPAAFDGS